MKALSLLAMGMVILSAAACSGGEDEGGGSQPTPTPDPNEAQSVKDARVQFPRFLDLQADVLSSTCSPNPGVCHNSSNYPNLETAGNTLAAVNSPCNVEIPDRTQGWDGCERPADIVRLGTGFTTRVRWMDRVGPSTWRLGIDDAADFTGARRPQFYDASNQVILDPPADWQVSVEFVTGGTSGELTVATADEFIADFVDSVLATVIGGDPNVNGIWGGAGADPGAVFVPGSLERSYFWGRITETVPGSRMPLANSPLTNPAYVAIACWIEGLAGDGSDTAEDPIDYDSCAFADAPIDYAIE